MMKTPFYILYDFFNLAFQKNKKDLFILILMGLTSSLAAIMEGGSFAFILLAFDAVEGGLNQGIGLYISHMPSLAFLTKMSASSLFVLFLIFAVMTQGIKAALNFWSQWQGVLLSATLQKQVQCRLYAHILNFSYPLVADQKIADLQDLVLCPSHFFMPFLHAVNVILVSFFTIIVALFLIAFISVPLTIVTLILFLLASWMQRLMISKIGKCSEEGAQKNVELAKEVLQSFQGIKTLFTFNRQQWFQGKVESLVNSAIKPQKTLYTLYNLQPAINEILGVLIIAICAILGPLFFQDHGFKVISLLITYITVTYRLATRVQILLQSVGTLQLYNGYIQRLKTHLACNKSFSTESLFNYPFKQFEQSIVFTEVFLQYPGQDHYSLFSINLRLKKSQTVALVGSSGSGKSSIVDLLVGLYKPTKGRIEVDGGDLQEIDIGQIREKIAVVGQDFFILNDTVENNIRFGLESASFDEVIKVAKQAQIHDRILKLEEGYQTIIGERGYRLSFGERQRLMLARALLKNPDILILDEATSNLDSQTQQMIQEFIETNLQDKTLLIVAHRLSTIVNADQIIVLDKGCIIEQGSHESLLMRQGVYAKLWQIQSGNPVHQEEDHFAEV